MSHLRIPLSRRAPSLFRCRQCMTGTMPLRAKITNPAFAASAPKSYASAAPSSHQSQSPRHSGLAEVTDISTLASPLKTDDPDDVVFSKSYGLRTIELNRPKKLNSLDGSMARKIISRLKEWEKSDLAETIVIKGAGRAFCAGGDVAALAKSNQTGIEGQKESNDYFALEYKLDHLIAAYPKPYIAYMDGITMGGGVGLSVHAPFRIATENTVFAMPETTIGFFPEVGASFFLPRMDGRMGTYLALTSEQLKGVDVFYHGIATHYIHSSSLDALSARIAELNFPDSATHIDRLNSINATIAEFETGLPESRPKIHGALRSVIDTCFDYTNPMEIVGNLETIISQEQNPEWLRTWAEKTLKTIRERSPTGVAVSLKQMQEGRKWDIARAFRMEHSIASHFMRHPDFVEGVTARLITRSKERPKWKPNTLNEVQQSDIDAFFGAATPEAGGTLALLESGKNATFSTYPHAYLGLPTEAEIVALWKQDKMQKEEIVRHFVTQKKGKVGVREKVEETIERKEWEKENFGEALV